MSEDDPISIDLGAPDAPSVRFAVEAMLRRLDELDTNVARVNQREDGSGEVDETEPVHRTRVACRRLRAAFSLLDGCVESETLHRWDRRVRRLARALGRARDIDVQLELVDGFMNSIEKRSRTAIERLRLRLVQRREDARDRARRKARRFRKREVIETIEQKLRSIDARARLTDESTGPVWLREATAQRIMRLVEQVLVHEPFIAQVDRVEELHQMRIAAKHLRYALEVVAPLHDDRIDHALEVARTTQRILGELHDCDVWIDFLPRFIRGERRRTKRFLGHLRGFGRIQRGLELLLTDRREARSALHSTFIDFWHRECGGSIWLQLKATLHDRPREGSPEESAVNGPAPITAPRVR